MSRVLTQGPASIIVTSIPARTSGSAATPPTAPAPMITTFVLFNAMVIFGPIQRSPPFGGFAPPSAGHRGHPFERQFLETGRGLRDVQVAFRIGCDLMAGP